MTLWARNEAELSRRQFVHGASYVALAGLTVGLQALDACKSGVTLGGESTSPLQAPGDSGHRPPTSIDTTSVGGPEVTSMGGYLFARCVDSTIWFIAREAPEWAFGQWHKLAADAARGFVAYCPDYDPRFRVFARRGGDVILITQTERNRPIWWEQNLGGSMSGDLGLSEFFWRSFPYNPAIPGGFTDYRQLIVFAQHVEGQICYRIQDPSHPDTWSEWERIPLAGASGEVLPPLTSYGAVMSRDRDQRNRVVIYGLGLGMKCWYNECWWIFDSARASFVRDSDWAGWRSIGGLPLKEVPQVYGISPLLRGSIQQFQFQMQVGAISLYGRRSVDSAICTSYETAPGVFTPWSSAGMASPFQVSTGLSGAFEGGFNMYRVDAYGGTWIREWRWNGSEYAWREWKPHGGSIRGPLSVGVGQPSWTGSDAYAAGQDATPMWTDEDPWIIGRGTDGRLWQRRFINTHEYGRRPVWSDWEPLLPGTGSQTQPFWGPNYRSGALAVTAQESWSSDRNKVSFTVEHAAVDTDRVEFALDTMTQKWRKWLILDDQVGDRRVIETDGSRTYSADSLTVGQLPFARLELWKAKQWGHMELSARLPVNWLLGGERVTIQWQSD